eukprot:TRINITY_DN43747_c0_g1_i2.p1 TRINITY_DN43747_c0_g1~~TRINITY_DN43747_c0_g1_i2.p1  ORF type:complete len:473 (-),score=50.32 TRINITY_DN43747_c0_g1_i2:69-1487(-)
MLRSLVGSEMCIRDRIISSMVSMGGVRPNLETLVLAVHVQLDARQLQGALETIQMLSSFLPTTSRAAQARRSFHVETRLLRALPHISGDDALSTAHACLDHPALSPHLPTRASELPDAILTELNWIAAYCGQGHPGPRGSELSVYAAVTAGVRVPELTETQAHTHDKRICGLLAARTATDGLGTALSQLSALHDHKLRLGLDGIRAALSADPIRQPDETFTQPILSRFYQVLNQITREKASTCDLTTIHPLLLRYMTRRHCSPAAMASVEAIISTSTTRLDAATVRGLMLGWESAKSPQNAARLYQAGVGNKLFVGIEKHRWDLLPLGSQDDQATAKLSQSVWVQDLHHLPHSCAKYAVEAALEQVASFPRTSKDAPDWLLFGVGAGRHGNYAGIPEMRRRVLQWLHQWSIQPTIIRKDKRLFTKKAAAKSQHLGNRGMVCLKLDSDMLTKIHQNFRDASLGKFTEIDTQGI